MNLQQALYPRDAVEPQGIDIGGDEHPRSYRSTRPYRGATEASVAAMDVELNRKRAIVAAMGVLNG